jgi:hypothetical protein
MMRSLDPALVALEGVHACSAYRLEVLEAGLGVGQVLMVASGVASVTSATLGFSCRESEGDSGVGGT